jgi:hypothetical protein
VNCRGRSCKPEHAGKCLFNLIAKQKTHHEKRYRKTEEISPERPEKTVSYGSDLTVRPKVLRLGAPFRPRQIEIGQIRMAKSKYNVAHPKTGGTEVSEGETYRGR